MVVFLYGRDGYRLKQNLEKIVGEYKKKYSGLSYAVLDLDETDKLKELEDVVKTVSFFDEKRLAVIKNAFSLPDKITTLIKTWDLAADRQRIIVFAENFSEEELAKKHKNLFAVLANKSNMAKSFEPLAGKRLESWIVKELAESGAEIEPDALRKLILYAGPDTWRLGQEINKLANFCSNGCRITAGDVDLLVTPSDDFNVFQVVDAIAGKNKQKAVALLYNQLKAGEDPHYIFSMIVYQFRNLLRVKSMIKNAMPYAEIVKKTKLNQFVVRKTYEQCRNYDLDELRRLFVSLAQTDVDTKSGLVDMEDCLYRFVFSLA